MTQAKKNNMDYEKKYNEMVRWAKELYESGNALTRQQMEIVFPELTESEDERMADMVLRALDAPDAQSCIESWDINPEDVKNWFIAYLKKQKEQKPADKDAAEPTPKQDYSKLNSLERAIHRGFLCAGVENVPVEIIKETAQDCIIHIDHKPAEWSGTNDLVFRDICKHLKEEGYGGWVVLLKALRDGEFKRPVQEWSEEDERILKGIIGKIDHDQTYGVSKLEMLSFLEKLRPQPKVEWSEEDEKIMDEMRETFISLIGDKPDISPNQKWSTAVDFIDRLKSLRPSWKPSEEQMNSLVNAEGKMRKLRFIAIASHLAELYEQLKKLM